MISSISSADRWWVISSLSFGNKVIYTTSPTCASVESRKCLEIQPQLTHIIRHFIDCIWTCAGTASSVGAWIVWISDVSCICGDWWATCWGCDDTADSESSCTVSIRTSTLWCALRAGETRSIGGCGAWGCTLLIWKLNNREQGESL